MSTNVTTIIAEIRAGRNTDEPRQATVNAILDAGYNFDSVVEALISECYRFTIVNNKITEVSESPDEELMEQQYRLLSYGKIHSP
jgi:hypothetical protein